MMRNVLNKGGVQNEFKGLVPCYKYFISSGHVHLGIHRRKLESLLDIRHDRGDRDGDNQCIGKKERIIRI